MRKYRLLSLPFALVRLPTMVRTAWAEDRQYYWEFIDAGAPVLENSDIRVAEAQRLVSPPAVSTLAYAASRGSPGSGHRGERS
jgi:hypothetical protein